MKKIAIMTLAMLCCMNVVAQKYWDGTRPSHRLTIGPRAGVNFANQYNNGDGADNDYRTGFRAGLELDVNIVRSLSINTGVYYAQKGYKTEYSDSRGSHKTTDNVAYIHIPLLVSYRVDLSDVAQIQINAGPYFAFGTSGKQKFTSTFSGENNYEIDSFDKYDGMKKNDIGISVGAAFTYSNIYFGIIYERGLCNVSNATGADFRNGCIGINVGYNFNLWR